MREKETTIKTASNVTEGPPLICSFRLLLLMTTWFAYLNVYQQRVNMNLAVICMLNHTHVAAEMEETQKTTAVNQSTCGLVADERESGDGKFTWNKREQGVILGAFFWGYISTQIIGGWLAERYGMKHVILTALVIGSALTALTPLAAEKSVLALVLIRVGIGMAHAVVFPATYCMWSRWAPPTERTMLAGLMFTGADFGLVLAYPTAGLLCYRFGWHTIFYASGLLGFVECILWMVIAANIPAQSRFVSGAERKQIEESIGEQIKVGQELNKTTAWRDIFTSVPVLGLITAHTCTNFGNYLIITMLPTYLDEVLHYDIRSNGFLSAVPPVGRVGSALLAISIVNLLRKRRIASTRTLRKVCTLVGMVGFGGFLVAASYYTCDSRFWAILFIVVGVAIGAVSSAGFSVNHIDLAPRYAGTLFGITNTVATIPGFTVPTIATLLTPDRTIEQWRLVFWLAFVVLLVGAGVYLAFGQAEVQPWALDRCDNDANSCNGNATAATPVDDEAQTIGVDHVTLALLETRDGIDQ